MEKLPTLYCLDSKGKLRQWTIVYDGGTYWTEHGQVDGKIQQTKPVKTKAKNVGKTNATTEEQQAQLECFRLWEEQIHKGYVQDIAQAQNKADAVEYIKPMLAKTWEEDTELPFDIEDVYYNDKLDGNRMTNKDNVSTSRQGKPIHTIDHIEKDILEHFMTQTDDIEFIDGELYNHEYKDNFQDLQALISKEHLNLEQLLKVQDIIQFHIYDIRFKSDKNEKFGSRYKKLVKLFEKIPDNCSLKLVKATKVKNRAELDKAYGESLKKGYEGGIIRLDRKYENKRTDSLLKRKDFTDEEYVISAIIEGEGNKSGQAGAVTCRIGSDTFFNSNIKGNREFCIELLNNRHRFIGKMGTIKFFGKSNDGIPRFPYLIKLRELDGTEIAVI